MSTPQPLSTSKAAQRREAERLRKRAERARLRQEGAVDPRAVDAALSEALVAYAGRAGLHAETRSASLDGVSVSVIDLVVAAGAVLRRRRGCTSAEATKALLDRLSPRRLADA